MGGDRWCLLRATRAITSRLPTAGLLLTSVDCDCLLASSLTCASIFVFVSSYRSCTIPQQLQPSVHPSTIVHLVLYSTSLPCALHCNHFNRSFTDLPSS